MISWRDYDSTWNIFLVAGAQANKGARADEGRYRGVKSDLRSTVFDVPLVVVKHFSNRWFFSAVASEVR